MTFLECRQRIAEELGIDATDTSTDNNASIANKLKEWVNTRYRLLCGRRKWNWMIKDTIIQTSTEITTGTITATGASVNITFSSGPAPSVAGWRIQIEGSDDWYTIATHTAAATAATLTHAYLGSTGSGKTYKLRKVYYTLPADCSAVFDLRQSRDENKLVYVPIRKFDELVPDRTQTGTPRFYTIVGRDSSASPLYRLEFYPVPNVAMNLDCRYYEVFAEMSADGDEPRVPTEFHDYLVWDVLGSYGYMFLDDTRVSAAAALAEKIYQSMEKADVAAEGTAQRRAFDDAADANDLRLRSLNLPVE